ncbi:hypothetical protein L7F22_013521 [Adiantum nelumboides]|nr:hypothetical protein [Adiantum nelumboides]
MSEADLGEFYVRYYVGHKGKFGHEFLEFEFRPDGKLRYANNSNYKNDTMIRKEVFLTQAALRECRRIIADSEVTYHHTISNQNYICFFCINWKIPVLVVKPVTIVLSLWIKKSKWCG